MGVVRQLMRGERGFTLLEVMISIVVLTFGLLAVASVLPTGLGLSLYGKDQTRSASLAQQEIECLKNVTTVPTGGSPPVTATLQGAVQDYGVARSAGAPTVCNPSSSTALTTYFDQNGAPTSAANAYFTRDVQVQYWTWNGSTQFAVSGTPYSSTPPAGNYVFRVTAATHWLVQGQTLYKSGQTSPNLNGCAIGSTAYTVGLGCVTASTFISP